MQIENLEQKVGLMDRLRGAARKTIGVYALTLALGGVLGGCETEDGDNGSSSSSSGCSYTVGGNKVEGGSTYSGCPSGQHCESYTYTSGKNEMGPTKTGYSCVSDSPPDYGPGNKW